MVTKINFNLSLDFEYGRADIIAPKIARIIANNPGPITFKGTGTYILGTDELIIIDAGPKDDAHLKAILDYVNGRKITHILVTHAHADHYPLSYDLQKFCNAKIYGHKPKILNAPKILNIIDDIGTKMHGFVADIEVYDGQIIQNSDISLMAIYTPGHSESHYCFEYIGHDTLFCGDHIMGWSSTVVLPPDGDMTLYIDNLQKISDKNYNILYPTHGAPIKNPKPYIESLIAHRHERDSQIINALQSGATNINEIAKIIYPDLNPALIQAAKNNIHAHLIRLINLDKVSIEKGGEIPPLADMESIYKLRN